MSFGLRKQETKDNPGKNQSGKIKGAGAGTSDEVKKTVPSGSYIMPTDSTAQIGEQNLQRLGKPTPVNLSNGEFQLSPDQVHQVGVHALNAMKNQTHTQVDQPQVQQGEQGEPELFFANGGLVQSPYPNADDVRRAQQARLGPNIKDVSGITRDVNRPLPSTNVNSAPNATPAPAQSGGFGARMLGKAASLGKGLGVLHGALSMAGGAVQGFNTSTEDYATRMGLDPNEERGSLANLSIRAAGVMSDVGNAASFGILGKRFPDKQVQQAQSDYDAQQARFAEWNRSKGIQANKPPAPSAEPEKFSTEQQMNDAMWGSSESAPAHTAQASAQNANPYAIQQKGNSFSYSNPQAAQAARSAGIPELQTEGVAGGIRRANDPRGVANLMQHTREFGPTEQQIQTAIAQQMNPQGQGFGLRYPEREARTPEQEAERQAIMRAASTPYAGSPRGQLTAAQLRIQADMNQGDANRAYDAYRTDANNATSQFNNASNNAAGMAQTMVREQGANQRAVLGEDGQNFRHGQALNQDTAKFNADFGLRNRQQNLTEQKEGLGIRQAQRVEKLQEMYDKAETPEQRQSILERLNLATGAKENARDRYMTVGGGQEWSEQAGGMVNRPQQIFDTQTRNYVDLGTSSGGQAKAGSNTQGFQGYQVYTDANGNSAYLDPKTGQFMPIPK